MTLNEFIAQLRDLRDTVDGAGNMQVFYRHGASGDCGELSSACITDEVDDQCGPFDLKRGEEYVSIYAGN
jgi:hypothetical protein